MADMSLLKFYIMYYVFWIVILQEQSTSTVLEWAMYNLNSRSSPHSQILLFATCTRVPTISRGQSLRFNRALWFTNTRVCICIFKQEQTILFYIL